MKLSSLLCAATLVAVASPAFADTVVTGKRPQSDGRITKVVSYSDLDITTAVGEKALMRRVSGAVRFVCSPAGDFMQESSCHSYAWRGARPQISLALDQAKSNPALAAATLSTLTVSAPF